MLGVAHCRNHLGSHAGAVGCWRLGPLSRARGQNINLPRVKEILLVHFSNSVEALTTKVRLEDGESAGQAVGVFRQPRLLQGGVRRWDGGRKRRGTRFG